MYWCVAYVVLGCFTWPRHKCPMFVSAGNDVHTKASRAEDAGGGRGGSDSWRGGGRYFRRRHGSAGSNLVDTWPHAATAPGKAKPNKCIVSTALHLRFILPGYMCVTTPKITISSCILHCGPQLAIRSWIGVVVRRCTTAIHHQHPFTAGPSPSTRVSLYLYFFFFGLGRGEAYYNFGVQIRFSFYVQLKI